MYHIGRGWIMDERERTEKSGVVIETTGGLRFHPEGTESQLRLTTLSREEAGTFRPDYHEIDLSLLFELGTPIRVAGDFTDSDWVYGARLKGKG
jgi:hypothetical protein